MLPEQRRQHCFRCRDASRSAPTPEADGGLLGSSDPRILGSSAPQTPHPTPRDYSDSFRVSLVQFTLSKAGKMKPLNESLF